MSLADPIEVLLREQDAPITAVMERSGEDGVRIAFVASTGETAAMLPFRSHQDACLGFQAICRALNKLYPPEATEAN